MQIPELDFEIPPEAQRGTLSTVFFLILFYSFSVPNHCVDNGFLLNLM